MNKYRAALQVFLLLLGLAFGAALGWSIWGADKGQAWLAGYERGYWDAVRVAESSGDPFKGIRLARAIAPGDPPATGEGLTGYLTAKAPDGR